MPHDKRYVIGLDSSTQSVKAIAWDHDGTPCAEGRAGLDMQQPQEYHVEQDATEWWRAACTALQAALETIDPAQVDAISISNQRETMALLDADGVPLAPATLWLDSRATSLTQVLANELLPTDLHRITGKPIDVTPCVYRLRWLRQHEPDLLDRTAQIVDVHGYLTRALTGMAAASWISADPFGIFDIHAKEWSRPILNHLGIPNTRLPAIHRPGAVIGHVTPKAAHATGLRAGTPVIAGGGDGHCAGLGVGAIGPGVVYLNLGTAVVGGLWSETAEISTHWRTLISATGEGYILEVVQRAGAAFMNWFLDTFGGDRSDPAIFTRLEQEAAALPIGSDGVTVCPYLFGCMNPHWDGNATASFSGMGSRHKMAHLYRASLEAITLEFARALHKMRATGQPADRIFAIGGGAQNQLWLRMIADSTGLSVIRSLSNEASALGAGILAAVGVGWYPDFKIATAAMTQSAGAIEPDPATAQAWARVSIRQQAAYRPTP